MEPREYCELFFGPLSPDDNITLSWLVGKRCRSKRFKRKDLDAFVLSVPGRIVTLSTKTGILGHWKRDLTIRGTRKKIHKIHTLGNQDLARLGQKVSINPYSDHDHVYRYQEELSHFPQKPAF